METASADGADSDEIDDASERWELSDSVGTTDVAINRYRIAPGEGLPSGLHAHADQEEIFVVLDGEATFETLAPVRGADRRERSAERSTGPSAERDSAREGREITVGEGEAIRFAPGEFQSGKNESDADLAVLAIGAPRDSEDVRIPIVCPDCAHGNLRVDAGEGGLTLACPDCGGEHVPEPCPECGHDDLRVALGAEGTVVVCHGCGAEFAEAPLRE